MKKTLTRAFLPSMLAGCLAATSAYAQPPLPDSPEWDRYQSIERDRYQDDRYQSDRYQDDRYERDRYERDQYDRDRYERDRYQNQRYQDSRYESQPAPNSPAQGMAPYVATKLFLMNQKEVELSRIGQQRAESPEVRRLAERMAQDHQNIVSQLEDLMDPRLVDFLTVSDRQSRQQETRYYRGASQMQESEMQMQGSEQSRMTQEERQRGSDYIDMQRQQGERFFNDSPPDAQNFDNERERYRRTTESESFRQSPADEQNLESDAQQQAQPQLNQAPNRAASDSSDQEDQEDSTPDSAQPEASSDDNNDDDSNSSSATPQTQGVSFLQDESEDEADEQAQADDRADDSDSSANQAQNRNQAQDQNQAQAQSGNQAQNQSRTQAQSQAQQQNQAQNQSRDSAQVQDRSMQSQQQRLQQDDRFSQDRQQFSQQERSFDSQQRFQQDDQQYQQQFSQRRSYDEEWSQQRPSDTALVVELIKVNQRAAHRHLEMSKRSLQEYAGEGQDFDMAFVGMAIAAHMHMLAELDAMQNVESSELRRVVQQTRSVAQEHLDQAKRLAQRLQDQEYDSGEAARAGSRDQDRGESRTIRQRQSETRRGSDLRQGETRVNRPIINQQFESQPNENPLAPSQTGDVTERADNRVERQEGNPDLNQE